MARPKKEINWDLVLKKMEAGCSASEIYNSNDSLSCNRDTFYDRFKEEFGCSFSDYSAECKELGKGDIRLMLHMKCLNNRAPGNMQGLIFKARCELGMKEPDSTTNIAANQKQLDESHLIYQLQNRIAELENNDNKPETE